MSENVADIRPTALGKWDEQLVKNTIEFSPPALRPSRVAAFSSPPPFPVPKRGVRETERERERERERKKGKKLISNFGPSRALRELKFCTALVLNF